MSLVGSGGCCWGQRESSVIRKATDLWLKGWDPPTPLHQYQLNKIPASAAWLLVMISAMLQAIQPSPQEPWRPNRKFSICLWKSFFICQGAAKALPVLVADWIHGRVRVQYNHGVPQHWDQHIHSHLLLETQGLQEHQGSTFPWRKRMR